MSPPSFAYPHTRQRRRVSLATLPGDLSATPLRHLFTRPYTPRTNGKVERFIKTALLEWAYARLYRHPDERRRALALWLHHYNWHRPHTSLGGRPPITPDPDCNEPRETSQLMSRAEYVRDHVRS